MNAVTKEEQTALTLTLPERAAVALGESANEAKLRELVAKSAGIVTVTNADGREEAHRAGMVLLKTRTGIRATGKAARDDATKFSKAVIAMEDDLIGIIEPEEHRVLALRDKWDEQIAAEKAAKIAAERARVETIQRDIETISDLVFDVAGKDSVAIGAAIDQAAKTFVTAERFAEFMADANAVIATTMEKLSVMRDAALENERAALAAEEARKAEALRIEQERATLAAQRAENERIANEQAATAKRLADQEAAQALAAKQQADKAAANLKAEQDAVAEQVRRTNAAQAEAAAKMKAAQDAFEAEKAAFAATIQRETDHTEALADNATFDTAMARLAAVDTPKFYVEPTADLARCNGMVDNLLTDARVKESLAAYADAGLDDPEVTDKEIMAMGAECGLTPDAWIERLAAFCGRMTSVSSTGQRYSRTTFKDNGEPIFLNADGSRSVFCDVAD